MFVFKIFQSEKTKHYYWRIRSTGNNKIVADGAEGYVNHSEVVERVNQLKEYLHSAEVIDETKPKQVIRRY